MSQTPDNAPRIAIACGGTGGHLFPGLAVARQLAQRGCAVTLLVSPKDVDQQALQAAPEFAAVTLPAVALQRGSRLAFCRGFVRSYFAARQLFQSTSPHAALAMGGFTSVPPVLAARRAGARTFLHESNTVPGRANRLLARWVDTAFLGFPEAAARLKTRQTVLTGTPVRPQFQPQDSAACRRALGLDPQRPVVLVMGGSQGASGVNELLLRSLPRLARTAPQWQWLHLTGPNDGDKVRAAYGSVRLTALVHPFLSRMELALGAADVAVTRAGASSLAELAALRLPAVLVPLPTAADNHQHFNAAALEQSGAARRLDQTTATPEQLVRALEELMAPGPVRQEMQAALARWHAPNAAADIATQILTTLPVSQRSNLPTSPTVAGPARPPRSPAHELEVAA
ncbi:MAG TPA: undecaprenyldiphospho-muramoylpentapeptide beta-N-acetylglucosaminyltransferase [Verrucomicrobiae bacterium]|nr:undecaprenyldiphospho-muramoylpentapeptide beta-N-acetylglucosaminyltransferase [Verrucomicrobiae bacterium]